MDNLNNEVTRNDNNSSGFEPSSAIEVETGHSTNTANSEDPMQQLESRIQSLEATNWKLIRENYFLKKFMCLQLEADLKEQAFYKGLRTSAGVGGRRASLSMASLNQGIQRQAAKRFPLVVLQKIFADFKEDPEILFKCRLVCAQWDYIITNTIGLMEHLTFPIWHPKLFLDLQIINQIKSIGFKNSFSSDSIYWVKFLDVINNSTSIRKVTFDYELDENSVLNQQKNFLQVLEKCPDLQELKIIGSNLELIKACRESTFQIASGMSITKFLIKSLDLNTVEDCVGISNILCKLPRLTMLEMFLLGSYRVDPKMLEMAYDYLMTFPGGLKELRIVGSSDSDWSTQRNEAFNMLLIKTALTASTYGTKFLSKSLIDFNYLLNLEETNNNELHINANTTKSIKRGKVDFDGQEKLKNLNRFEICTKLKLLFIKFTRNLNEEDEISFLRNLPNLKILILLCEDDFALNWESIKQLDQMFYNGFPKIEEVVIGGEVFGSPRVILWNRYFPNLKALGLGVMKNISNDIFIILSTLKKLERMLFCHLNELEDEAFTISVDNIDNDYNGIEILPAIATCFPMLKILQLGDCPKLTNKCIVDGISKITTLEKLHIQEIPNITENVYKDLHFKVICELVDYSEM